MYYTATQQILQAYIGSKQMQKVSTNPVSIILIINKVDHLIFIYVLLELQKALTSEVCLENIMGIFPYSLSCRKLVRSWCMLSSDRRKSTFSYCQCYSKRICNSSLLVHVGLEARRQRSLSAMNERETNRVTLRIKSRSW